MTDQEKRTITIKIGDKIKFEAKTANFEFVHQHPPISEYGYGGDPGDEFHPGDNKTQFKITGEVDSFTLSEEEARWFEEMMKASEANRV